MNKELDIIIGIAKQAGEILKKHFGQGLEVEFKKNEFDPVTQADKESDEFIRKALAKAFPDDEILSEENDARPTSYSHRVWMVDPLDGTKDFVAGRGSFSVMIGLLDNNVPTLGAIYNPITEELFYAEKDHGAFRVFEGTTTKLHVSDNRELKQAVLVTRNLVKGNDRPLDEQVNSLAVKDRLPEGSIGLKLGRIVEGKADVFIHTNLLACKWDTLAAQVMLTEAEGVICDLEGNDLDYTKGTVGWDKYFVAANNRTILEEVLQHVKINS